MPGTTRSRRPHWLWVGGPVPKTADAVTLGSLVIMRKDAADSAELLRHEQVHVRQWRRFGVLGFLWHYVGPYLRWRARGYPHMGAYRRIPFEAEAYWKQRFADH